MCFGASINCSQKSILDANTFPFPELQNQQLDGCIIHREPFHFQKAKPCRIPDGGLVRCTKGANFCGFMAKNRGILCLNLCPHGGVAGGEQWLQFRPTAAKRYQK